MSDLKWVKWVICNPIKEPFPIHTSVNLSLQTLDNSFRRSVICILNGTCEGKKFNRPTSYIIIASSNKDRKLPMPFEHGHQINERQVQWQGLIYSTFQQDLGGKKRAQPAVPSPFPASCHLSMEKANFFENFTWSGCFINKQGHGLHPSFHWSRKERRTGKQNNKGEMLRKERYRKRLKRQLLGRLVGDFQPLTSD